MPPRRSSKSRRHLPPASLRIYAAAEATPPSSRLCRSETKRAFRRGRGENSSPHPTSMDRGADPALRFLPERHDDQSHRTPGAQCRPDGRANQGGIYRRRLSASMPLRKLHRHHRGCADRKQKGLSGEAAAKTLHPIQQAWIEEQTPLCGFCQNGMMIKATELLEHNAAPTVEQIKEAFTAGVSPHLCRCGSYTAIIEAVQIGNKKGFPARPRRKLFTPSNKHGSRSRPRSAVFARTA